MAVHATSRYGRSKQEPDLLRLGWVGFTRFGIEANPSLTVKPSFLILTRNLPLQSASQVLNSTGSGPMTQ